MTTKRGTLERGGIRMAADLLWFAAASMGAGLMASIAVAALVMLLAQPAHSEEPVSAPAAGEATAAGGTALAADERRLSASMNAAMPSCWSET